VPPDPYEIPARPYWIAGALLILFFGVAAILLLAFGL